MQLIKQEIDLWIKTRHADLLNPDGFLALTGLAWLKPGINRFGSGTKNDCHFPKGLPAEIGYYDVGKSGISVTINSGIDVTSQGKKISSIPVFTDKDRERTTILKWQSSSWFIIKRGDALGIRIRDSKHPALAAFKGVERFDYDPDWRAIGRFEPHPKPKTVSVPSILGTDSQMISPGMINLELQGKPHSLLALKGPSDNRFFLIIADQTSGKESYGGGRFIHTEALQADGTLIVDFNKAKNPPCAFTPYATCPLPPEENKLGMAVEAGEKRYRMTE